MTPNTAEADSRFDVEIKADQLRLLYEQSFQGVYLSLASAGLLAVILWPHTPRSILLGWIAALVIASIARVLLFIAYRRTSPQGTEMIPWGRPYLVTLMLSASVWGIGGVWIMPPDSLFHATVVYYFLMGMAGAATSAYSAIRHFTLVTLIIILLPATLWMLAQGETAPVVMALAASLLFISAMRTSKALSNMLRQNYLLTHELNESKEAAERLARIDVLTGLNNRRAFTELADSTIQLCQRNEQPYAAIVLDIDHFKQINDSHGHAVGDQALQHIAQVLQNSVRKTDICARTGGEEFAVLLPDADRDAAIKVAEKVRLAIMETPLQTDDGPLFTTASLGVACISTDLESLLRLADEAMYQAKQDGRNQVVCQQDPAIQNDLFAQSGETID